jgi:hypothetical protein
MGMSTNQVHTSMMRQHISVHTVKQLLAVLHSLQATDNYSALQTSHWTHINYIENLI